MGRVVRVAIALGSNLGDRRAHLEHAVVALKQIITHARVSTFVETAPVGVPDEQPDYLNGVMVGNTALSARDLLTAMLGIERAAGRERVGFRSARTLDLDLILYGADVINEPDLVVPHPRFREREFVVGPLREIAPELLP